MFIRDAVPICEVIDQRGIHEQEHDSQSHSAFDAFTQAQKEG
jgi:hypothetical protein